MRSKIQAFLLLIVIMTLAITYKVFTTNKITSITDSYKSIVSK